MKRLKPAYLLIAAGAITLFLATGCGKSLFAPLTSDRAGNNPERALERAEYLYLGGSVEEADAIYVQLMESYKSDTAQQEVYYEAVRGHSKCVLEIGGGNTTEMLKGFVNFFLNIDTDTFETDPDQLEGFNASAADFRARVWSSFEILQLIPDAGRTEGDYANMSISGLFAVCTDFAGLMGNYVAAGDSVMEKIDELDTKIDEFNAAWAQALINIAPDTNPDNFNPADKTDLKAKGDEIQGIKNDIDTTLGTTMDVMATVSDLGDTVKTETANATNPLTAALDGVFNVILETINGTLPALEELEAGTGDINYAITNW